MKMVDVKDIADIVQAIAVAFAAYAAWRSLFAWRDQHIGQRKMEIAEEALTLAYELQGVIEWARHPASFGGEGEAREGREEEPEGRRGYNDAIYSRISRLSEHEEVFAKLRTVRVLFRAYFVEEAQEELAVFNSIRNEIATDAGELIRNAGEEGYSQDLIKELENSIWDTSRANEPDEIRQRVNDAVTEIERVCRPILAKG